MKKLIAAVMALMLLAGAATYAAEPIHETVRDQRGAAISGASIYVYRAGTTTLATLYVSRTSTTTISNPTTTNASGSVSFYVDAGYYDLKISRAGITTQWKYSVPAGSADQPGFNVVTDFGAVGNYATDDSQKIQAAIDAAEAAGGGTVVFPEGGYVASGLTVTASNVTLMGEGPGSKIISTTAGDTTCITISASNCTVEKLRFVGQENTEDSNECLKLTTAANDSRIRDCVFSGLFSGIGFNCQIRVDGADRVMITDNKFEFAVGSGTGSGYGIIMVACDGGIVSGNVGVQTATAGRHHVYLSAGTDNVVVTNNVFSGGTSAQITLYSTTEGTRLTGNIIAGNNLTGGTDLLALAGSIEITGFASYNTISGNTINGFTKHGIKLISESDSSTVKHITVDNNQIIDVGLSGILIEGAADCTISGNHISGAGAASGSDAIRIVTKSSATVDRFLVSGNSVVGNDHLYALRLQGDYNIVGNNRFTPGDTGTSLISAAGMYLVPSAEPDTAGMRGMIWFDSANSTFKGYVGGSWVNLH